MRSKVLAGAFVIMALHPAKRIADVNLAIIEYRVLPQIGQVRLTTGHVHDPAIQWTIFANPASFDRRGIILVGGDSVRRFNRRETIGSHSVETTISVYPATGHGYRGGLATAAIIVMVDGRKRIDCPYDSGPTEIADVGIKPLDGIISILATYGGKSVDGMISLKSNETIDTKWLARNAR
jgi:hypothetical protein